MRRYYRYQIRKKGVCFGEKLHVSGMPIISMEDSSEILLGNRVVLTSIGESTALAVNHPVVLRTLQRGASILIGDDVGISGGSICAARSIEIGDRTMLGANVTIADTDFHPLSIKDRRYSSEKSQVQASEIHIGRNVFVGTNAIILKGVRIGDNAVIGAGSVVTGDIPPNCIAAGNPCRVIRKLGSAC